MEKSFLDIDVVQDFLNSLPKGSIFDVKPKKKNVHINSMTFFDIDLLNSVMFMYSYGIFISDISNYIGLSEREINGIIDAYVECLF